MTQDNESTSDLEPAAPPRQTRILQILVLLGMASALWALFLWRELLRARAGEKPFCGFGESTDCDSLWSAGFASSIHDLSGLPVAAWGLVWSLVATALPLLALVFVHRTDRFAAAASGTRLTAGAGLAGIAVLLGASAAEGMFCTSCAVTYLVTLAYAAVTYLGLRSPQQASPLPGATLAGALTAAAYLILLYPGLETPKSLAKEGQRALAAAGRRAAADDPTPEGQQPQRVDLSAGEANAKLREFLGNLPQQALQGLSDSLYIYKSGPATPPEAPRVVALGPTEARVRITEFHDTLCSHCATLHQTMDYLATLLPKASFQFVARHFPLDGNCNPHLQVRGPESVRCLAARAQICAEEAGRSHELSGILFEHQQDLTKEQVFELAAPIIPRQALEACVASPATARKLSDDIEYAWRYRPEGTPLVLINGRRGTQFGPFIYAMVLARGNADHPAFASLPAPSPGIDEPHDHDHDHG